MSETLDQALSRVWEQDWRHRRSGKTLKSQAELAIKALAQVVAFPIIGAPSPRLTITAGDVSRRDVQLVTTEWYGYGVAPATIQKRLNCLSKLGVNVEGCRVKVPKGLKWHLPEDRLWHVLSFCITSNYKSLGHLIMWTCRTGLRIEESLRLKWSDFGVRISQANVGRYEEVSVPGTKTSTAQARLPLGENIGSYMQSVRLANKETTQPFPWTYEQYQTQWNHVREHFGWQDDPTATLKALRRSAARYLHVDCGMPLHMVQQYLRHESMDTTLEYLRLAGGYGTEEMRRYLK